MAILKILPVLVVLLVLGVGGYLVRSLTELPSVATWTTEEAMAVKDMPSDRAVERQIRALTERDPEDAASMGFQQDGPWLYGVRTEKGLVIPGIPEDSTTGKMFQIKIVSWTGEAMRGERLVVLDRAALVYATKFNRTIHLMLVTN